MCGIFGGIGNLNHDKIRTLAVLNEVRGNHSFGFYMNGKIVKKAESITEGLKALELTGSFIIGHTRFATHGEINQDNCHPFQCGEIIGVHNGIVYNHDELNKELNTTFAVDSQVIFELISRFGIKGLEQLEAYYGLAWTNKSKKLFLCRHNNELAVIKTKNAVYFSSDLEHLKIAGILGQEIKLKENVIYSTDGLVIKNVGKAIPKKHTEVINYSLTKGLSYSVPYSDYTADYEVFPRQTELDTTCQYCEACEGKWRADWHGYACDKCYADEFYKWQD